MAYYIICLLLEIPMLWMTVFMSYDMYKEGEMEDLKGAIFLAICSALFLIISIAGLVKRSNGRKKTVGHVMLMKSVVFFACFALMFLAPTFGEYRFYGVALFGAAAVTMLFATLIILGKDKIVGEIREVRPATALKSVGFTSYKSEWAWEAASKEYCRITGKNPDNYGDDDIDKIFDYASMPIIYFLTWLFMNGHMSSGFYLQMSGNPAARDALKSVKERRLSPVDFFRDYMDYVLNRNDIEEKLGSFLDDYVEHSQTRMYGKEGNDLMFDYYEVVRDDKKLFYCVDFSWANYDNLAARIEDNWEKWQKNYNLYNEDDENTEAAWVHSKLWNADISVTCSGKVTTEYIAKCEACLNNMEDGEINKMCEMLIETYDKADSKMLDRKYGGNVKKVLQFFIPDEMVIFTPEEDEPAFCLLGESELEEEHGISVTIRNGFVLDTPEYRMDYESPWSDGQRINYLRAKTDCDIRTIRTRVDAERAVREGRLVKTVLNKGTNESVETYLTPAAIKEKEKVELRSEVLSILEIQDIFRWTTNFAGGNPVPDSIYFRGTKLEKPVFLGHVDVWK